MSISRHLFQLFILFLTLLLTTFLVRGSSLSIDISDTDYNEGEVITADIDLILNQPFTQNTLLKGKIGNTVETQRNLLDIFDAVNIDYEEGDISFTATNPSTARNLYFTQPGSQYVLLQLPQNAQVDTIDLDIHGFPLSGSYPNFVSIDVGLDNNIEWTYYGQVIDYGPFVLPQNLNENLIGGSAFITDKEEYYCEIITLPVARDYQVFANYQQLVPGGNLSAVIFSITQTPTTISAVGGAETCDLPDNGTGFNYQGCTIHLPRFIQGQRLVCVYNENAVPGGSTTTQYFSVALDAAQGNGYICNALSSSSSSSTCTPNIAGDFFIKVSAANYSGQLIEQVPFSEGFTEFGFKQSITAYLSGAGNCNSSPCPVPIRFSTTTPGFIYIDDLALTYSLGPSGSFSYSTFYEAQVSGGLVNEVEGVTLGNGNGTSVTIPLSELALIAPEPSQNVNNYTLTISLVPGPSNSTVIIVRRLLPVITGFDLGEAIETYKGIFNEMLSTSSDLLDATGYKTPIQEAITTLNTYKTQYIALNSSNGTITNREEQIQNLTAQVTAAVDDLPRTFAISKEVQDEIVASLTDITDDVVFPNQRNQKDKDNIFLAQSRVTIDGTAQYYNAKLFDGTETKGTVITKDIQSTLGNGNVVEIIPSSAAPGVSAVTFTSSPTVIQQSNPAIVSWSFSNTNDATIVYHLPGDKVSTLQELITLIIPQTIPEPSQTQPPSPISYRCGDGICSVLETDQGPISLEDAITCPQDCKKKYSFIPLLISLLLIAGIIYYINFYHGTYDFKSITSRFHGNSLTFTKPGKALPTNRSLFISSKDEESLRTYIKETMKKGFGKTDIIATLSKKGWSRDQIDFAMKTMKK